jgi:single-strand DNA-binding protein
MSQQGINKVILIGNLGQDPEVKQAGNGNTMCRISVATSESWKDKDSGEIKEKTAWHRVVVYGKIGDVVGQYCRKGSKVYIEAKLAYGKYDKDGVTHYTTDIVASNVQFLDSKKSDSNDTSKEVDGNTKHEPAFSDDSFDDDIPF